MAGVWVWAIQIMMPVPLVFVLLLALPTPRKVKSFIITVCKRILDLPTFGHMRLFHFALLVSSWMFVAQSWGAYSTHKNSWELRNKEGLSPCEKTQMHADKWRHDRNFWIASLILMLWIVLHCFYHQADSYMRLTEQLEEAGLEPSVPNSYAFSAATDAADGAKRAVQDATAGAQDAVMNAVPDQLKGTKKTA